MSSENILSEDYLDNLCLHDSSNTLHLIEQNHAELKGLYIGNGINLPNDASDDQENFITYGRFVSESPDDSARFGACVMKNTNITNLVVDINNTGLDTADIAVYEGLKLNKSIKWVELANNGYYNVGNSVRHPLGEAGQQILNVYQENNTYLSGIKITCCDINNGGDELIAKTLSRCVYLTKVTLGIMQMTDVQLSLMIEALKDHPMLQTLKLYGNRITNAGCQAIANLLEDPTCNLEKLNLYNNDIDNDGAVVLINSLRGNKMLQDLWLHGNAQIDHQSMEEAFSQLLCNTSSINDTYSSNHLLEQVRLQRESRISSQLASLLIMNFGKNKDLVAIKKILKYHPKFDMTTLFNLAAEGENNLKALPFVVSWFSRAVVHFLFDAEDDSSDEDSDDDSEDDDSYDDDSSHDFWGEYNLDARKLSAVYQFAQAMPLLFVPASHTEEVGKKRKRV